ncbi:type II secretion system protein [Marinicella sp. S1101]|uniref:PulJ/GspJ family protein n=1 Tax=Marinicella marina TaxID=2996016 RepID=UPI002260DE2D|nr:type II secretion system protein [Marinicella marina]MCX7554770.1 type II secretion system protein [Marinicella marina]MDJ1140997.1 type II secretion system protein [Marinicella marina]
MRRQLKQQGMTLLEVLVAAGILAVISAMAFMSIDTLASAKASLDAKNKILNNENLAVYLFQTDLQMATSSQQYVNNLSQGEFIANSQSLTFLKYQSVLAPVKRTRLESRNSNLKTPLIRVRWYVRNDNWYRATQQAAMPLSGNQWQERLMMPLNRFNCGYENLTGVIQPRWPNDQRQFSQLPDSINCEIENAQGQVSTIKVVPWQQTGFL